MLHQLHKDEVLKQQLKRTKNISTSRNLPSLAQYVYDHLNFCKYISNTVKSLQSPDYFYGFVLHPLKIVLRPLFGGTLYSGVFQFFLRKLR